MWNHSILKKVIHIVLIAKENPQKCLVINNFTFRRCNFFLQTCFISLRFFIFGLILGVGGISTYPSPIHTGCVFWVSVARCNGVFGEYLSGL